MNTTPYMFLDIDGVANGNFQNEIYQIFQHDIIQACFVDPAWGNGDYVLAYKLNTLANICNHFSVKVVVVSAWATRCKVRNLDNIKDFSKLLGMNVVDTSSGVGGIDRGKFVLDYVTKNNIEKFLIVDDSKDFYENLFRKENCIFPHGRYGLQDWHFEEIYAYYNNSKKWVYEFHSTKFCSNCRSERLIELSTYNMKVCGDCGLEIEWKLDEGQKPRVPNNRIKN